MRGARGSYNAKGLKDAAAKAERALREHPPGKQQYVDLTLQEITTREELFQPREFVLGERKVSTPHVKKLAKHMGYKQSQQLDPIVVINLGAWVCVDGHHRIAAYESRKHKGTINCEWFRGTVRQAIDASVSLNNKVRLEIPLEDRQENAWKRTLLGWGSKSAVGALCGVSEGTVSLMRRVKARYDGGDGADIAKKFARELGQPLEITSWSKARLTWLGLGGREVDEHAEAGRLARSMRSRMEDRLSRDAMTTARALAIYDPDLPVRLCSALRTDIGERLKQGPAATDDELGVAMIDALSLLNARELGKLKDAIGVVMEEGQSGAF
jgi:hypothetical protein